MSSSFIVLIRYSTEPQSHPRRLVAKLVFLVFGVEDVNRCSFTCHVYDVIQLPLSLSAFATFMVGATGWTRPKLCTSQCSILAMVWYVVVLGMVPVV